MSEFENQDISEKKEITKCVIGITNSSPYDISEFVNNLTTFYTKISYTKLNELYLMINELNVKEKKEKKEENEENEENKEINKTTNTININLLHVINSLKDSETQVIFRFLCSSDCLNGLKFIDDETTQLVYKFVNQVSGFKNVIIEISDHSMGAFFNCWDNSIMSKPSPIQISNLTHEGNFKMYGLKQDFINCVHPTLKQIGEMSADDNIEIKFNNMNGTKVFKIIDSNVRLISKGVQIKEDNSHLDFIKKLSTDNEQLYEEVPVHCEFDYNNARIIVSATHWCNLESVENNVDLVTLRRYCTDTYGEIASQNLDFQLSLATDEKTYKHIISTVVREISSGTPMTKNISNDNNFV